MKRMICCLILLIAVVGGMRTFAQTLVFHLANGTSTEVELTTDFKMSNADGKTIISLPDGTTQEFAQSDILTVTYTGKRGDVNRDGAVDVADIANVISIMADKESDDSRKQTFTVNGVSFTMLEVEGGTFQMGATATDGNASSDEKPSHEVEVNSFYIGQTEVTQELWEAVMDNNPSKWKGLILPVEMVSWNDCQTFITKLNLLTGQTFRLPTEAEWEFAAHGGNISKGYKYSGSDNIDIVAWYSGNSSNQTHEVATKSPNELGIYDMSGNVWEWCQDWFGSSYYSSSVTNNPSGPATGNTHVLRGGCWNGVDEECRVVNRGWGTPARKDNYFGFRLAL